MISVVMSVYNEPRKWLEESINSILAQTYSDFEFIIVIDNTDLNNDSLQYLKEKESLDKRIILIFNDVNMGLAMSLNKGINATNGEYIARMDADDIAYPDRFEKELKFLIDERADMVSTNCGIIDENSNFIRFCDSKKKDPSKDLPYTNSILHPSVLMKKNVFISVGGYRDFRRSQDYDLWLRLLLNGNIIRILDEPLMKYRLNQNSLTMTNRIEQYYTNLYQISLYKERLKKGNDSFSKSDFKQYIEKKHITQKKNNKCILCMKHLDKAKSIKNSGSISFIFELSKAFLLYPSIVLRSIIKSIKRQI